MRKIVSLVLYTAFLLGANGALAADTAALSALRQGDMKKMNFHSTPKPLPDVGFMSETGAEARLQDYQGKYVLVNFWATWCAPCRAEMPMLDALQASYGGDRFEVVTIATGHNPPPAMKKFFADAGVENLPLHRDPKQMLARGMAVMGLPVSVLLDPEGREIGRLMGDADWSGTEARALIEALIASES
ncbi:TlpA disulfide reductase family protein [Thalassovita sp.]|uniref:TlpA family protein disulfide reductase n=1 Tax=Thalassovita sp. TaxID=1979401 RepID=UPI002B2733A7|nr:TlpA disulfide reductase family protein [Thalassovita sp.]